MLRKPTIVSWLLLLSGLTLFLGAAHWQYQRALGKDETARTFAQSLTATDPPLLDWALQESVQAERNFQAAWAVGALDREHVILLDNQVQDGRVGVLVFAPLRLQNGQSILVNLGWLPWPDRRVPVSIPPLPAEFDSKGLLTDPPSAGLIVSDGLEAGWPKLTISINVPALAKALKLANLSERVFWPQADPASGFVRAWKPPGIPADRHRGYALQWLSFAIAALILFVILHRKKKVQ